jgi:rSAM/selenodomain-associated transferase 1
LSKIKPVNALIVFVRYPETGKVKTRLAEETDNQFARVFYKLCAENTFGEISSLANFDKYIFYSEKKDRVNIVEWTKNKFFYAQQVGSDLGEKMHNAFEYVLKHYNKAIIIGTDIPDLSREIIDNAAEMLEQNDIVIGPSKDGGYYLLGIKKNYNELFENIEWSTESVFDSTIRKAKALNLKIGRLQSLQDIDNVSDLNNWLSQSGNENLKNKISELIGIK